MDVPKLPPTYGETGNHWPEARMHLDPHDMCVKGVQNGVEGARLRGLEVCLLTLTTWGLAVRKSRIQVLMGVFRPSSISLSQARLL